MRQTLVARLAVEGLDYPVEFWPTLKYLSQNDQATQHEIADHLLRDKATVARLVSRMETEKLVVRSIDSENRRQKRISLTAHGLEIYKTVGDCARDVTQQAKANLSAQQLSICEQVLLKIFANLQESSEV